MATKKEIDKHLKIALEEVGEIKNGSTRKLTAGFFPIKTILWNTGEIRKKKL
ncbi:MAG: hypothetical protein LLG04_02775 [Parachlamydia sp.]|nr:hypothetical protein [Parachlamydia sp.]